MHFLKKIPKAARAQEEDQQKSSSVVGIPGFLLLDSNLVPIYANDEAIRIFAYPKNQKDAPRPPKFLLSMVQSLDLEPQGALKSYSIIRFMSGKRHYTCRLFPVSPCARNAQEPAMALLIERNPVSANFLEMAEEFRLTPREDEAVQHLGLGLTSKEIGARMGISPNTAKAFLRLVMIKTGVTTRSGIIGKFLKTA